MRRKGPTLAWIIAALLASPAAHAEGAAGLSLADAIRIAQSVAPELRAASARTARADADHDAAIAGYLPRLAATASGSGAHLRDTLPPIRQPFTLEPYSVQSGAADGRAELKWTLWDFGRTSGAVASAGLKREAAEHDEAASRASVTRTTASLFFQVVFDEQIVDSKRMSVDKRARHAAIAKALVDKGVRAAIDEVRARLGLQAARHELALAEARLEADRARLAGVLGMDPEALGQLERPSLPALEAGAKPAADRAERDRAEVASAAAEARARDEALDAARAQYLPSIGLGVAASYRLTKYVDVAREAVPRTDASAFLTVTVPIFDAHTGASVSAAHADLAASQAHEQKVRRAVRTEAAVAAIELRTSRALVARARELATSADATLAVMEARYKSGLATPLELVDAEASDVEAREAVLGAELRLALASVDVAVATGRASMLVGKR